MSGDRAAPFDPERVLSGESGIVEGRRRRTRARMRDLADDAAAWLTLAPLRVRRAASRLPVRRVLVLGVYAPDGAAVMARADAELRRSRHEVRLALGALGAPDPGLAGETLLSGLEGAGKFENLNALRAAMVAGEANRRAEGPGEADWTLVIDDDVELPRGFLDAFLACAEAFDLQLAQPAHRHSSHAAWAVCRRTRWTLARRTRLVEIGPLTAFHSSVAGELIPFPALRMGWGLDAHWGGLALERGWRLGIVDATPIRHRARRPAARYDRADAIAEITGFLRGRPHIDRETAGQVVERHRTL
jgi:hypothetical protein